MSDRMSDRMSDKKRSSAKKPRITSISGNASRDFEPFEAMNPIPWPVIAIALALTAWGLITLLTTSQQAESKPDISREAGASDPRFAGVAMDEQEGQQLFVTNCSTCHQNNGAGIANAVPPLAQSRYVLAAPEVPVNILLFGIEGEIEVAGNAYNGRMPTFGHDLNDKQIAAILSHVRSSWGNQASAITADQVAEQRERFADRTRPWAGGGELAATFGIAASSNAGSDVQATASQARETEQ